MLALECLTGGRMYLCVCACALEDTLNAKEKEVFGIGEKE